MITLKEPLQDSPQREMVISNIIDSLENGRNFLVLGHKNPDEDCLASMVAISLLISKFNRSAYLYISGIVHQHFQYLLQICRYNSITVIRDDTIPEGGYDTIIACDTPKLAMLDCTTAMMEYITGGKIQLIEIDHHIGADSTYIAEKKLSFVDEASSACELIGELALWITDHQEIRERNGIGVIFSRNLVLALLTGIVGDSQMGRYFKSDKERESYELFSAMYSQILRRETTRSSNISSIEEIFTEIRRLSDEEDACREFFSTRIRSYGIINGIVLDHHDSLDVFDRFAYDTVVSMSRSMADSMAESSGYFGLVVFYDRKDRSNLVQFRIRRSQHYKGFDLREILRIFGLKDGGGHEGAIAFRVEQDEIKDLHGFLNRIVHRLTDEVSM